MKQSRTKTYARRQAKMDEIEKQLMEGVENVFTTEKYGEWLNTMMKFHEYSFCNSLLIAVQKPEATHVAGYNAWQKKFKRYVKKGEKGIKILAPCTVVKKDDEDDEESDGMKHTYTYFRVATVFDISQTEGEDLPQLIDKDLEGDINELDRYIMAIRDISPLPVKFKSIDDETVKGYCDFKTREIVVQNHMSDMQTLKTCLHEVAHSLLHDPKADVKKESKSDRFTREVQAESVAYCVCNYFGLDTSEYSFPYVASWSKSMKMDELKKSMDLIKNTASKMVNDISASMSA